MLSTINLKGHFLAEAFRFGKRIYRFFDPNKIVLGSSTILSSLLGGRTQAWDPPSTDRYGITKFVLYGIDITLGTCQAQALAGDFGTDYDHLNPTLLTEITVVSFPCMRAGNTITASTVPAQPCNMMPTPGSGVSYISSNVLTSSIEICVRVGVGYVPIGETWYYALAALVGQSPDPADANEYVYAIEQFPSMIKTSEISFQFLWTLEFTV